MSNPSNPWERPVGEPAPDEAGSAAEESSEHLDEVTDETASVSDETAAEEPTPGESFQGAALDRPVAEQPLTGASPSLISSSLAPKITVPEESETAPPVTDFTLPEPPQPPAPQVPPTPPLATAPTAYDQYAAQQSYGQPAPPVAGPAPYAPPAPPYAQPPASYPSSPYGAPPAGPVSYPVQPYPPAYQAGYSALNPSEEATWASAAHWSALVASVVGLGFLGPLIVMLTQGTKSPRVRANAVESLNFEITFILAMIASVVLMLVLIGFVLVGLVPLVWFVLRIIASIQTANGQDYRYPVNLRLVK